MKDERWRRLPAAVAAIAAGGVMWIGLARGTWAVGGSDSSCYGLMAQSFANGQLQPTSPLALTAPWPDRALTLAPAGFLPSPVRPDAASPICMPGFSLLAAPLLRVGGSEALFLVAPLSGALLVWSAFLIGRQIAGPWAGAMASTLVAFSPIVVFQVVQPMNDVTTAALWLAVVAALGTRTRAHVALAGALTGVALLVRPNLLGLGIVAGVWTLAGTRSGESPNRRFDLAGAALFAAMVAPFGVLVLWLNAQLYGGLSATGYGSAASLFSTSHVSINLRQHLRTLAETQTVFVLIGFVMPLLAFVSRTGQRTAWLALAMILATAASYLPYRPYPEWWYLRFLLPAVALLIVLASASVCHVATSMAGRWTSARVCAPAALGLLTAALVIFQVREADRRLAFDLQAMEARFRLGADVMRDRFGGQAVALAVWNSGSLRFHAGREAVLWDSLEGAWLDRAVAWLAGEGHDVVLILERWEEPLFRARFNGERLGALDWPPRVDIESTVRIYVPADRDRYLAGDPISTETVLHRHPK